MYGHQRLRMPMTRAPVNVMMDVASLTGRQTNSQDPSSINCRVFVGNLNTANITKNELENMFGIYGQMSAVSIHKGYAFVQYNDPATARIASESEDGRMHNGMRWDVNMAAEPKSGGKRGVKRPGTAIGRRMGRVDGGPRLRMPSAPQAKKPRPEFQSNMSYKRTLVNLSERADNPAIRPVSQSFASKFTASAAKTAASTSSEETKSPSSQDVFICGWCKELFRTLISFINHRERACTIKVTCKCKFLAESQSSSTEGSQGAVTLQCATCKTQFENAWDLCHHVQSQHNLPIYTDRSVKPETEFEGMNESGDAGQSQNGE